MKTGQRVLKTEVDKGNMVRIKEKENEKHEENAGIQIQFVYSLKCVNCRDEFTGKRKDRERNERRKEGS